jgi:hypothetical protein
MRPLLWILLAGGVASAEKLPKLPRLVSVASVTASSTYEDKKKSNLYDAWRVLAFAMTGDMHDQVPATAWCEGKPDEGIGESVTVTFSAPTAIDRIYVAAGVHLTPKLFKANNQIVTLEVIADGKPFPLKVPKKREFAELKLGVTATTLVFRIAEVKKGKMNDSCISGIDLRTTGAHELIPIIGVDAAGVAALPGTLDAIYQALADRGPKLEALIDFPIEVSDVSAFFNGAGDEGSTTVPNYKALAAACKTYLAKVNDAVDYLDPKGCPGQPDFHTDREIPLTVKSLAPGVVEVYFPAGREVSESWRMIWKGGKWKLGGIGYGSL